MIDQATEEQASLYVLDLLEREERDAFEARLAISPELRQLLRELQEGLYGPVRQAGGPARPDLLPGILVRAASEGAAAKDPGPGKRFPGPMRWSAIWAAAALVLLGLNLFLFSLLSRAPASEGAGPGAVGVEAPVPGTTMEGAGDLPEEDLLARIRWLEEELASREAALEEVVEERSALSQRTTELQAVNSGWQREYARLASRMLPFFKENPGMSRFTVIELVDREVIEKDLPRLGFTDLAGRFLTGEANISGANPGEFIGPVIEGAGVGSASTDAVQGGLNPFGRSGSSSMQTGISGEPGNSEGSGTVSEAGEEDAIGARPAGFTVWRDDEQKGFLDLYNLPSAGEGEEAYLWVRSSELEAYKPVGELPSLDNGTGSFFYSVDEPNFTPTEILITAEPIDGAGSHPAGDILLKGP